MEAGSKGIGGGGSQIRSPQITEEQALNQRDTHIEDQERANVRAAEISAQEQEKNRIADEQSELVKLDSSGEIDVTG